MKLKYLKFQILFVTRPSDCFFLIMQKFLKMKGHENFCIYYFSKWAGLTEKIGTNFHYERGIGCENSWCEIFGVEICCLFPHRFLNILFFLTEPAKKALNFFLVWVYMIRDVGGCFCGPKNVVLIPIVVQKCLE